VKSPAELDLGARPLRFGGQPLNQRAPFDNQIGELQSNRGGAPVGEKFEAANFVDDAAFCGAA
jgi:hypothetical protein